MLKEQKTQEMHILKQLKGGEKNAGQGRKINDELSRATDVTMGFECYDFFFLFWLVNLYFNVLLSHG